MLKRNNIAHQLMTQKITVFFGIAVVAVVFFGGMTFGQDAIARDSISTVVANGEGAIVCPDGTVLNNVSFTFSAHQTEINGPIKANFGYMLENGNSAAAGDPSATGDIAKKRFNVDLSSAAAVDCFEGLEPFTFVIGECGTRSQVNFSNGLGQSGAYLSEVLCF